MKKTNAILRIVLGLHGLAATVGCQQTRETQIVDVSSPPASRSPVVESELAPVGTDPSLAFWRDYRETRLYRLENASTYLLETDHIAIDADGAPNAYHPENIGLDDLRNAGYPNTSWWSDVLARDPDRPERAYVQPSGSFAGYFVSMTALVDADFPATDPRRYVDATSIPYFVFPGAFARMEGTGRLGDIGFAWNRETGDWTGFVVADIGPTNADLGEVSIALAEELGGDSVNPRNGAGAPSGPIVYIVFPYSSSEYRWPLTPAEIDAAALELGGGLSRLRELAL